MDPSSKPCVLLVRTERPIVALINALMMGPCQGFGQAAGNWLDFLAAREFSKGPLRASWPAARIRLRRLKR